MYLNKNKLFALLPFLFFVLQTNAEQQSDFAADYYGTGSWTIARKILPHKDMRDFAVATEGDDHLIYAKADVEGTELVSKGEFGDSKLAIDFMLTKDAQAAIYLQGRYAIAIADSYSKSEMTVDDAGGLLNRMVNGESKDGVAPSKNAAKSAGEWQRLEVLFRGPRFDAAYNKIENAMFIEVKLNGQIVHKNSLLKGFVFGAKYNWEEQHGPLVIKVNRGAIVFRDIDIRHADFAMLEFPQNQGESTNIENLVDFVILGKDAFISTGCGSCHAVEQNDVSVKSGPNLFGLFGATPRQREVVEGEQGDKFIIKADANYLHNSIRKPAMQLAVVEQGAKTGDAYLPIMPAYGDQVITDKQIEAIGSYLATLNTRFAQGPVIKLVGADGPQQYDPQQDSLQLLVGKRVRIQRGPMPGLSGRSIHVGQPSGIHYSFDPRILSVSKIWQGGFLEASGEWTNRGGRGLALGFDSRTIDLADQPLLAPLDARGLPLDFSFKEAVFNDFVTVEESLYSDLDHADRLRSIDAQFLGYEINSQDVQAVPFFKYRIGKNQLAIQHQISPTGEVVMHVGGQLSVSQRFKVNQHLLRDLKVSSGSLSEGIWTIPKGSEPAMLTARIAVAPQAWQPKSSVFNYLQQPLKAVAAKADLPEGYSLESYLPPKDNYGRDQLFEALGMAVAEDGTVVVATRTAGIWRLSKGKWHLFAEGLFDSLGVQIEDKHGLVLVAGQKAELTRVADRNGDGLADSYETLYDAHSYHGNYHTYLHGPTRGGDRAYYFALNLAHADKGVYKAGGAYMGAVGGYTGWAIRVSPNGESILWASGLRSPAGIATAPDGKIWYTENQGEYVATSKMFLLKQNAFYGHPAGLVDLPGMTPDSPEIAWEHVSEKRERPVVLFPHNEVANSPGHPVWDTTNGRFGAFAGQIFVGDQTQSNLLRVATEVVNGVAQGVVMPFADGLASGAMRPVFLSDGSLLIGQTGRGWQARGGHVASLQRLVWDGKTRPQHLYTVSATPEGFAVEFVNPLGSEWDENQLQQSVAIRSWVYRDAPDYGSETLDERDETVRKLALSSDRKKLFLALDDLHQPRIHPQQTARVYRIQINRPEAAETKPFRAYYTLYEFPSAQ